jgi:hypothetical protein
MRVGVKVNIHVVPLSRALSSAWTPCLAGPNVRRDCPDPAVITAALRNEMGRRQRRSDGTVNLAGQRFEIHLGNIYIDGPVSTHLNS